MVKLSIEIQQEVDSKMKSLNFIKRTSNGITNYVMASIKEGIELKGNNINSFVLVDGERVYGYDNCGNEVRDAIKALEIILFDDDTLTHNIVDAEIAPKNTIGVLPTTLTEAIIAKHPGTLNVWLSLQCTAQHHIKERKGPSGKLVQYVDTSYMITAMNYSCLMNWSFEVLETRTDELDGKTNISVLGCISAKTTDGVEINKQQWGSQVLKVKMEMGDALKAAASDSMKKCASMYGIAADVYSGRSK